MKSTSLEDLGDRIVREHQRCLANPATALVAGCQVGRLLQQAQQCCPPASWEGWLRDRCGLSPDTAQTYLQVARSWKPGMSVPRNPAAAPPTTPAPAAFTPRPSEPSDEAIAPPTPSPPAAKSTGDRPSPTPLTFFLPGIVVPKARPRVTQFGTFLPSRYRNWRLRAEGELILQVQRLDPVPPLPIERATVRIRFQGKFRVQADLDNLAGAVLDALTLQGAGILKNDNLSCVPSLNVDYVASDEEPGARIEIHPL